MGEGKNLVGVDIGSSSVKVCQLKETRKGFHLQRVGFAPVPAQTIVDGQVMDAGRVVEAVQQGMRARLFRRGRYSPGREQAVHHFHRLLAEFSAD